jgi:dihydrofolate reductase
VRSGVPLVSQVIHSINSTLNGCCSHEHVIADEEHHAYAADLIASADALLFGRTTFELLQAHWPGAAERSDVPSYVVRFAKVINQARKYVAAGKSFKPSWPNSTLVPGDIRGNMKALRADNPGRIVIFGSPSLARALTEAGEIDESHILIQPLAVDREPRLFSGLHTPLKLPLLDVRALKSGVLLARYSLAGRVG